jgi:hypothetical protein
MAAFVVRFGIGRVVPLVLEPPVAGIKKVNLEVVNIPNLLVSQCTAVIYGSYNILDMTAGGGPCLHCFDR